MANIFDGHSRRYDAWYETHRFAYLSELEAVKKALPETGTGLEIGVGTGRFAAPLGIRFGIDPSGKMLRLARKRGVDARLGCGERLPFGEAVFDYVALIITLCFVENPGKVLGEAARVLKNTGKIIAGIIDKNSFLGERYQRKRSVFYTHAKFLGVEELSGLLKSAGFCDIACYQTLFDLPGAMTVVQEPEAGYGRGGFVVLAASRR